MTETIKIIGTKPRLLIIRHLGNEERSFNELKRLSNLSSRTLALNLRFLMQKHIVDTKPEGNRSHYVLTQRGKELIPILVEVGAWGEKWAIYKPRGSSAAKLLS